MMLAIRLVAALGLTAAIGLFDMVGRTQEAVAQAMILPVDSTPLVVKSGSGDRRFTVEVADEPAERSSGLMFRTDMPDDRGMLFVLEGEGHAGFWMKNTPLPLDLLFIGADGRIKAILHGEPQSEALISPEDPVRYVLELKAGTAMRAGIKAGDVVVHPAMVSPTENAG